MLQAKNAAYYEFFCYVVALLLNLSNPVFPVFDKLFWKLSNILLLINVPELQVLLDVNI